MTAPKRKSIRFKSIPMSIAYLDISSNTIFKPQISALVANESYTGCAIIIVSDAALQPNQELKIKIANLDAIDAHVVWCKTLEENIHKVGLKYKD